MTNYYNFSVKDSLSDIKVDPKLGLSAREVERRRAEHGSNILNVRTTPLWRRLLEPFTDLFMIILIAALILSIIQQSWPEVIIISIDIVIDALIYYIQQFSTERVLRSLRSRTVQQVTALRDGAEVQLDASELVPGDIVVLHEGDRIPADGRIIVESGLLTNESMLTGESESIAKDAKAISGVKKVYEQRNMVFSGSFVVTGSASMVVTATGNHTEYGRIASLASGAATTSPIQDKINSLVIKIAITVLSLAVVVFIIQIIDQIPIFEALKFTLAMIVSAVPEDLPIVTAIILALGARRMAKKNALIKELRAIQSIGIVTTIASDKTGTLTENRLRVREIWSPSKSKSLKTNETFYRTVAESAISTDVSGDPLDSAIYTFVKSEAPYLTDNHPVKTYAFDQSLKLSGCLYENRTGGLKLVVKGAPETVLARCTKLSSQARETIETQFEQFSARGFKVIAIASAKLTSEINELNRLSKSDVLKFEGLVAVADSVRPEAVPAIERAATSGVKVVMVTGDHAQTAFAIGRELGLATDFSQVLDCSKLGSITDDDLAMVIRDVTIFARVTPEDKYRILSVIKRTEVVAMTGDGVNDVPALTNAHIGIAMGDSPSIVQDAGDIVLVDNNFASIIDAMEEGRVILANIRRMLIYLLATNAGEVLCTIGALIFGGVQLLPPIQILWINMVTDSLMVVPIGLEPAERRLLNSKPESKNAPILSRPLIVRMILISTTMAAITLATYFIAGSFYDHAESQTLAFVALVAMQWASACGTRGIYESFRQRIRVRHPLFWVMLLVAIGCQFAVLFTPLGVFLGLVQVPFHSLAVTTVLSFILPLIVIEVHKLIVSHLNTKHKS